MIQGHGGIMNGFIRRVLGKLIIEAGMLLFGFMALIWICGWLTGVPIFALTVEGYPQPLKITVVVFYVAPVVLCAILWLIEQYKIAAHERTQELY